MPARRGSVDASSDASLVGDEAVLHAREGADIVVVGRDRVVAAATAGRRVPTSCSAMTACNTCVSARTCEVAVIDRARRFGNGHCLPAGPLREPAARIGSCHAVVEVAAHPERGATQIRRWSPRRRHVPREFRARAPP